MDGVRIPANPVLMWIVRWAFRLTWVHYSYRNRRERLLEWSFMHCGRRWRNAVMTFGERQNRERAERAGRGA